jgi:DNA-binding NarL/FixJ family response regulator
MPGVPGSVLIVDDHQRFRASARRALEAEGWTVLGEAVDGTSGLQAAHDLQPEVVLLDVGLPDMSGLEVARVLHGRQPDLAVVLVSTQDAGDYGALAAEHGARGFLTKSDLSGDALDGFLSPHR